MSSFISIAVRIYVSEVYDQMDEKMAVVEDIRLSLKVQKM